MIGFAPWPHVWWLVVLTTCFYALYYERIMLAEEAFLRDRFGEAFEKWAAQTPAFIPRFHGWKPSSVPFCGYSRFLVAYTSKIGWKLKEKELLGRKRLADFRLCLVA
jgi:hypothetical protein